MRIWSREHFSQIKKNCSLARVFRRRSFLTLRIHNGSTNLSRCVLNPLKGNGKLSNSLINPFLIIPAHLPVWTSPRYSRHLRPIIWAYPSIILILANIFNRCRKTQAACPHQKTVTTTASFIQPGLGRGIEGIHTPEGAGCHGGGQQDDGVEKHRYYDKGIAQCVDLIATDNCRDRRGAAGRV